VYQQKVKMKDQLLYHILDAVICVKDNPTELIMIHRGATICIKAESGHFENLLQTHQ
jgi:hypothetical protein